MGAICRGLRVAIDTKQCPEVLILLSFIVPFRSNDQNEAHLRANGSTCDASSHRVVRGGKILDGRTVISAIVNSHPSKETRRSFSSATVPLGDPKYHDPVYESMSVS